MPTMVLSFVNTHTHTVFLYYYHLLSHISSISHDLLCSDTHPLSPGCAASRRSEAAGTAVLAIFGVSLVWWTPGGTGWAQRWGGREGQRPSSSSGFGVPGSSPGGTPMVTFVGFVVWKFNIIIC